MHESATLTLIERISYRTMNNARRNHATFVALAVAAWFRQQALQVGGHADEMRDGNSDTIFDDNSLVDNQRLERSIIVAYLAGLLWANRRYALGAAYSEDSLSVVRYRAHVNALVAQLNATTKSDIRDVLTNAKDADLSDAATVKALKQLFVSYETTRATLVGSYESTRAFNLGMYQAFVDSGVAYEKQWLTAGDERVEQECLDNAAQGWIGLTVTYNTGEQCPPAHVGCRCALDFRKA